MFSEEKRKIILLENNRQESDENERKTEEGNIDVYDRNKFPVSSDFVITCQQSSLLSLNEKRNQLLKLIEKGADKAEELRLNENNKNASDDEDKQLTIEESEESNITHLPLEVSGSDSEEEEKDNDEEEGNAVDVDENQYSLDSICGLSEIKESLLNILIYPSFYPQFFPKKIRWNQILLYGPPGTGKTMLAKALAYEINASLHKVTSADLLSHWQGHTEKQIKTLFQEIHFSSEPKILFFDEIDGLFRRRTNDENDNTRRIKTELLIHLDEFTADFENHKTFLIGATNCPWEIDSSFMRRFHKKIYVPLPDKEARLEIIKKSFDNVETDLTDLEWNNIGETTEGYSGSDLVNVVMASCCERFLKVKKSKFWEFDGNFWVPVSSSSPFSTEMDFQDIHPEQIGVRSIIFLDLMAAIEKTPKTVERQALLKYLEFSEKNKIE